MPIEPPQGWGFGLSVRLKTMSLRQRRMMVRAVAKFGRDLLGDGGSEESIDKLVGQTGDQTSEPKQTAPSRNADPPVRAFIGHPSAFMLPLT